MSSDVAPATPAHALSQSRGWMIFCGILSVFVGFLAMGSPLLFSFALVQVLAIFALVSGIISLALAIFSRHVAHRFLDAILALIRIAFGFILIRCLASSVAVITLIVAIFLTAEGISLVVGAFRMRGHKGWIWTLVSGIAGLVLGLMVWAQWPSSSLWVLGLFFGINSVFWGISLLTMGLAAPKAAAA